MPHLKASFPGWDALKKMVDMCSGMSAHSAVSREDVLFFAQSMALLRARNALEALEELQSEMWPRDLVRL